MQDTRTLVVVVSRHAKGLSIFGARKFPRREKSGRRTTKQQNPKLTACLLEDNWRIYIFPCMHAEKTKRERRRRRKGARQVMANITAVGREGGHARAQEREREKAALALKRREVE